MCPVILALTEANRCDLRTETLALLSKVSLLTTPQGDLLIITLKAIILLVLLEQVLAGFRDVEKQVHLCT